MDKALETASNFCANKFRRQQKYNQAHGSYSHFYGLLLTIQPVCYKIYVKTILFMNKYVVSLNAENLTFLRIMNNNQGLPPHLEERMPLFKTLVQSKFPDIKDVFFCRVHFDFAIPYFLREKIISIFLREPMRDLLHTNIDGKYYLFEVIKPGNFEVPLMYNAYVMHVVKE